MGLLSFISAYTFGVPIFIYQQLHSLKLKGNEKFYLQTFFIPKKPSLFQKSIGNLNKRFHQTFHR